MICCTVYSNHNWWDMFHLMKTRRSNELSKSDIALQFHQRDVMMSPIRVVQVMLVSFLDVILDRISAVITFGQILIAQTNQWEILPANKSFESKAVAVDENFYLSFFVQCATVSTNFSEISEPPHRNFTSFRFLHPKAAMCGNSPGLVFWPPTINPVKSGHLWYFFRWKHSDLGRKRTSWGAQTISAVSSVGTRFLYSWHSCEIELDWNIRRFQMISLILKLLILGPWWQSEIERNIKIINRTDNCMVIHSNWII